MSTGTSTAKSLWEAACSCVPEDVQLWTLEDDLPLMCCYTLGTTTSRTVAATCIPLNTHCSAERCDSKNDRSGERSKNVGSNLEILAHKHNQDLKSGNQKTSQIAPTKIVNTQPGTPSSCKTQTFGQCGAGHYIVNCNAIKFESYDCTERFWKCYTTGEALGSCKTLITPSRLYLGAGSWCPSPIDCDNKPLALPKIELFKALDAIVQCFISCTTTCWDPLSVKTINIPNILVDTSILVSAFYQCGYCGGHYKDSNGNPVTSACQLINDFLSGENLVYIPNPPITGDCGCACPCPELESVINICNFPCLASRLICTDKLKWVLETYIACLRTKTICGCCSAGTV